MELGGWEEVEVHEVAELRGAYEVHLGGTCGEGLSGRLPVRLAGIEHASEGIIRMIPG